MPIGKKDGKISSPIYNGGAFPGDLPKSAGQPSGPSISPVGQGGQKNPPASNLGSPARPKGDLATSGKDLPDTSGPSRSEPAPKD
jgi:hypothetical protein